MSDMFDRLKHNIIEDYDLLSVILTLLVKYKPSQNNSTNLLPELSILLDQKSLINLITYFSGKTITIPSLEDLKNSIDMLLLYNYSKDGYKLSKINQLLRTEFTEDDKSLVLKLVDEVISDYNHTREII